MRLRASLTLLLAISAIHAKDTDWPRFRGPDANPVGADARLPDRWSATENVEWSASIPGRGWSSPIVTGGRIYLTSVTTDGKSKPPQTGTDFSNDYAAELAKQGLSEEKVLERLYERDIEMPHEVTVHYYLYCLDLKTGDVIWKKEMHSGKPPGGRHRKNSYVSETPVTDGKLIYVYVGNLGLYAYRLNGEQAWMTPLESHPIYLDFGTGGSPALHGNLLIIVNDNEKQQFIAAFDKRTGKQLWRTDRDVKDPSQPRKSGWTTPFIWSNKLREEIVTVGPGVAISYDLAGKELWRLSGFTSVPAPSPFAYDGLLYLDGGQPRPIFAIKPGASGDISLAKDKTSNDYVVWSAERAGTYIPTPVAYDGGVYVLYDKGFIGRYDARTGEQTYKARIELDAGAFTSSPWAYNGKIFCINEEGKTFVMAAGKEFKLLHTNSLGEMALATPAIVGDRLLIRTESKLYSIRQNKQFAR